MNKLFSELKTGDKFQLMGKDTVYEKTKPQKISCCKSLNAREISNAANKIFVQPGTIVEYNNGQ